MNKTYTFKVAMTCEGCGSTVEKVLNRKKGNGVDNVEINVKDQLVKVEGSLSGNELLEIIQKTGKNVELLSTN